MGIQDTSYIYVVVFAGLLGVFLAVRVLKKLAHCNVLTSGRRWIFRHVQKELIRRTNLTPPISRFECMLQVMYWCGTACFNAIGVHTPTAASNRAALATICNLAPLLIGGGLDIQSTALSISRKSYQTIHATFGTMTTAQLILYLCLKVRSSAGFRLTEAVNRYGLLAVLSTVVLVSAATSPTRSHLYESFLTSHRIMTIILLYSLWHFMRDYSFTHPTLLALISVHATVGLYDLARLIARNYRRSTGWSRCRVIPRCKDLSALELRVKLACPLAAGSGQYVQLTLPGVSMLGVVQQHPFCIAWWEENEDGLVHELSVLVHPRRGLTARLLSLANSDHSPVVLVRGPFGRVIDTTSYGSIVLVASGIGIAAVMGVIKQTMNERRRWKSAVQKITLAWEVTNMEEYEINEPFMKELLAAEDTKGVLNATIFVKTNTSAATQTETWGARARMVHNTSLDGGKLLKALSNYPGRQLLCVSAHDRLREETVSICRSRSMSSFDVRELDFQPEIPVHVARSVQQMS